MRWIWHDEGPGQEGYGSGFFRYNFEATAISSGWLYVSAKGGFVLFVNGKQVADEEPVANYTYDVGELLRSGTNVIAISARCERDTPTGLLVYGCITQEDGSELIIQTDESWLVVKAEPADGWKELGFDDSDWADAISIEGYLFNNEDSLDLRSPLVDSNDPANAEKVGVEAKGEFATLMSGFDASLLDGFIDKYCPSQRQIAAERIPIVVGAGLFPVLCKLANGDILAVFRAGASHVGLRGRLDMGRSTDEGRTWSPPYTVIQSEWDDRNPALGQMADGTVVLGYMTFCRRRDRSTDGLPPSELKVTRSNDNGQTWETPEVVDSSDFCNASPFGKILLCSDGSALMSFYGRQEGECYCSACWSRDDGRSWTSPQKLFAQGSETALMPLANGELLALARTMGASWLILRRSKDNGKTWSEPTLFAQEEQPIHPGDLILLSDGRVLATYGFRIFPYGTRARISNDQGKTWSREYVLVSDSLNWDCGYPSSVERSDGSILTAHYATASRTQLELGVHCMGVIWRP